MVSDRQLPNGGSGEVFFQEDFQEYVFFNNGNVPHKVVFGLWYQDQSDMHPELFRINGVKVKYQL
jgi:hypothetical protein